MSRRASNKVDSAAFKKRPGRIQAAGGPKRKGGMPVTKPGLTTREYRTD